MASIWWVVAAFFAGGFGGAMLVALLSMSAREEHESLMVALDPGDESRLRLSA